MKQRGNKSLVNVVDEEREFNFRLYVFTTRGTSYLISSASEGDSAISPMYTGPFGYSDGSGSGTNLLPSKTDYARPWLITTPKES